MNSGTGLTQSVLKARERMRQAGIGRTVSRDDNNPSALDDFFRTQLRRVRVVAGAHYSNVLRRRRQRRERLRRHEPELQMEIRGSCGSDVHLDIAEYRALL